MSLPYPELLVAGLRMSLPYPELLVAGLQMSLPCSELKVAGFKERVYHSLSYKLKASEYFCHALGTKRI
jgi:hypothetical protein